MADHREAAERWLAVADELVERHQDADDKTKATAQNAATYALLRARVSAELAQVDATHQVADALTAVHQELQDSRRDRRG